MDAAWLELAPELIQLDLAAFGSTLFPVRAAKAAVPWIERHMDAALDWIETAHVVAPDGGISKGYDLLRMRWDRSYPETTGYTIPTLLNASSLSGRSELVGRALTMADYLLSCSTKEGGVSHWAAKSPRPIVFDTGQVIFGWLAAHRVSSDERYLEGAKRAGDWLVSIQDSDGCWLRSQHLNVEKTIDTRVAWALVYLSQITGDARYRHAAVRNLEWALSRQDEDGWFRNCSFTRSSDPFTHNIAYTAEGLFESGMILGESRYMEAARKTAVALLERQRANGSLAGTFSSGWRETSWSSCLTGNCQVAELWLRFYSRERNENYLTAAEAALGFVASRQTVNRALPKLHGGIPGSSPAFGCYERFKYPNWAAKFFVDAMLALKAARGEGREGDFVG